MGYILKREGVLEDEEQYRLTPEFLMEMMELNEAVENVEAAPDTLDDAKRRADTAFVQWETEATPLMQRYDGGERSPELLAALKDFYYRKKYLLRIKSRFG